MWIRFRFLLTANFPGPIRFVVSLLRVAGRVHQHYDPLKTDENEACSIFLCNSITDGDGRGSKTQAVDCFFIRP